MSWEARGAMLVPKTDVVGVGVAIDAVSPIRVVVLEVVIIVVVMVVVVEMMSDTSEVVGTCYKNNQLSARKTQYTIDTPITDYDIYISSEI